LGPIKFIPGPIFQINLEAFGVDPIMSFPVTDTFLPLALTRRKAIDNKCRKVGCFKQLLSGHVLKHCNWDHKSVKICRWNFHLKDTGLLLLKLRVSKRCGNRNPRIWTILKACRYKMTKQSPYFENIFRHNKIQIVEPVTKCARRESRYCCWCSVRKLLPRILWFLFEWYILYLRIFTSGRSQLPFTWRTVLI
jgi:hypothetical protein